jgi:hypothetical protein
MLTEQERYDRELKRIRRYKNRIEPILASLRDAEMRLNEMQLKYIKDAYGIAPGDVIRCTTPGSGLGELVFVKILPCDPSSLEGPYFIQACRTESDGTLASSCFNLPPDVMTKVGVYNHAFHLVTYDKEVPVAAVS